MLRRHHSAASPWAGLIGGLALAFALALTGCGDEAKRPLGASCTDGSQCQSGSCQAGICVDPGAVDPCDPAAGEPLPADCLEPTVTRPWRAPSSGAAKVETDRYKATLTIGATPLGTVETDRYRAIIGTTPGDIPTRFEGEGP